MKLSTTIALVAALFVPALTGCVADEGHDVGSESSDVEEGSSASCEYSGPGNARYKEAVAAAKAWSRGHCDVMTSEVYAIAQAAVDLCPGVGPLIARSEWAGELRDALGPLEVAYLAGELGEDGALEAEAVAAALGDGITLHANGQGVYGAPYTYILEGDRYQVESLVFDETGESIPERKITENGSFGVTRGEDGALVLWVEADEVEGEVPSSGFWVMERTINDDGAYFMFGPMGEDGQADHDVPAWEGWLFAIDINECSA